ncbi:hypothetical protein TIFTF001_034158 [Ficus carica]|uniref:Uncharacterized protein n=1 Tax=Ficus carica TaxID=3494 RepID=A0AA88DZE2_FICCA|nr:hypothetical protein TIFTF001_034158 [Ficus carica]
MAEREASRIGDMRRRESGGERMQRRERAAEMGHGGRRSGEGGPSLNMMGLLMKPLPFVPSCGFQGISTCRPIMLLN